MIKKFYFLVLNHFASAEIGIRYSAFTGDTLNLAVIYPEEHMLGYMPALNHTPLPSIKTIKNVTFVTEGRKNL